MPDFLFNREELTNPRKRRSARTIKMLTATTNSSKLIPALSCLNVFLFIAVTSFPALFYLFFFLLFLFLKRSKQILLPIGLSLIHISSTYSPGFGNFSSTFFLYFIFYTLECIFLYFSVYFLPDLAEFSLFCCFPARCRYHDIISQSYCFCLFYFPVLSLIHI